MTEREISRFRYNETSLWLLRRSLGGTRARRLFEKLELHFKEDGSPLILDLRETSFIDSEGALVLEAACRRYRNLAIIGKPRDFDSLPLHIRTSLTIVRPYQRLEEAFASLIGKDPSTQYWETKRRHTRVSVEIPVEIYMNGSSAVATLRDLSLGGGRIGQLPYRWINKIKDNGEATVISITGLEEDPLGREIVNRLSTSVLPSRPVHILSDLSSMGVKFAPIPFRQSSQED